MNQPRPIQLVSNTPPPDEDTPDLLDEEIAKAIPTKNGLDFGEHLKGLFCSTCEARGGKVAHKLCRRRPHYYSRVKVVCPNGHKETFIFLVDWLKQ